MAQTTIVLSLAFVYMLVAPSLAQSLTNPTPMYFGRNATEVQVCLKTIQEEVQLCNEEMTSLALTHQTELIGPECCRGYYLIDEKCRPHGVTFDPFLPPVAINDRCLSIGAVPTPPSLPSSPIKPSPKTPSSPSKPKPSTPSAGRKPSRPKIGKGGPSAPSTPEASTVPSPTNPAPSTPSAGKKPSPRKTGKGGPSTPSTPKEPRVPNPTKPAPSTPSAGKKPSPPKTEKGGPSAQSAPKAPSSKSAGKAPSTKSSAKPPSSSFAVAFSKKTELHDVNSWQLE